MIAENVVLCFDLSDPSTIWQPKCHINSLSMFLPITKKWFFLSFVLCFYFSFFLFFQICDLTIIGSIYHVVCVFLSFSFTITVFNTLDGNIHLNDYLILLFAFLTQTPVLNLALMLLPWDVLLLSSFFCSYYLGQNTIIQLNTHAHSTGKPSTPPPNAPTLTYLDKHQSQHPSYTLQMCSFLWPTAVIRTPNLLDPQWEKI